MRDLGPFGSTEATDRLSSDAPDGEGPAVAGDPASQQCGRFRLLRLLGQGGMEEVHAAHDGRLDRVVALKMARGDRNTALIGRFIREARALAKLPHPSVVQIFAVSTLQGAVFLAMEELRGRTLREEMAARRREGEIEAIVDLFLQAGRGLAAVYAAGLVHRDLKPDNVMVGDDGRVRLAGATGASVSAVPVPVAADEPRGAVEGTAVGAVDSTPAYMSPGVAPRGGGRRAQRRTGGGGHGGSARAAAVLGADADRGSGGRSPGGDRPLSSQIHESLSVMLAPVDPVRALHHADQAIARDGAPELVRERLSRRRAIAELTARDPAWRQSLSPR